METVCNKVVHFAYNKFYEDLNIDILKKYIFKFII